ncbi:MAG: PQQ-binding-like beta-propeller repeat protein [Armatimonadota bacterium]|nr:PQQ-binding-like beta-propeller repeat protein [bacterium]
MRGRAFRTLFPLIAVLLGLSGQARAQLADTAWPCFGRDTLSTRNSPYSGPANGLVAWQYQIGGTGASSPAVGDGRIYVVSDGQLVAMSATGEQLWSYDCNSTGASSPAIGSNGTIYVASTDGYLYAVTSGGILSWKKSLSGSSECSPAIGSDGTIYVGSSAKKFFAFYASGTQKFSYTTSGSIVSSPAIASDGTIYFGCDDGILYALNSNGTLKWKLSIYPSAAIKSSPAIGSDGTVYVGSMYGYLHAIRSTGIQKWKFSTSGAVYSSPAIAPDGSIIFGSRSGSLYCLNTSGAQKWKYYVGGYVDSSPAVDSNGAVYFGANNGYVYSVDSTGALLWSTSIGTGINSSPAIGEAGTLYALSYDGSLCAFGTDTTPPPAPTVTDDGTYCTESTTLHASWSCEDTESGISKYEYAIGTSSGAEDLVAYTDAGTVTEITRTDLSLVNGEDYYFSVRATNGAGLLSDAGFSNGIRVDYTPPATPVVIDDGTWTSLSDQLHAVFGSGDTESGISYYEYCVGTAAGLADIRDWVNSGTTRERTITGMSLAHGVVYYVNVRAYNHAGLMSEGHSNGIAPDLTAPAIESIAVGATSTQITGTVTASDSESGVSTVQYVLLDSTDIPDSPEWQSAVSGEEFTISGTFNWNNSYYIAARAQNSVGAWSEVELSEAIKIDDTPPTTPTIIDDGIYSTSLTSLHASWSSTDSESGIDHYAYCVGTISGSSNIVAWTTTTNDYAFLTSLSLTNGTTYYFTVRAVNGASLTSENGYSDGIKIDTTPPTAPVVTDDGDVTYSSDTLHASWISTDAESGLAEYFYCIGTSAGSADIVGWTSTGTQSWVSVSGLALQSGVYYYFTIKVRNGAGLVSALGSSDGITYQPGVTVWPKFRCDAANTGCAAVSACLTGNLRWRCQTQGYVESSAAIGEDGTVYVGSSDGVLYAINSSGAVRWTYQTGGSIDSSPAIGSGGEIYVGSYDGGLYCIASDGGLNWRFNAGGMIWSSPNLTEDGSILFGCQNGYVYELNLQGNLLWSFNTGSPVWSSPAIASDGSIYFGCGNGKLYALTSSGTLKWTYTTGSAVDSSPAIGEDGVIYFGSGDASFYAINPDGTKKWSKYIGLIADSSPAISDDGTIYFGAGTVADSGAFYALSSNGNTLWKISLPDAVRSSPAIASNGTIYFGCVDGTMHALNANGTTAWSYKMSDSILSSPALGPDGSVIAGSDNGIVYCFRDSAASDTTPPTTPIVTIDPEILTSGETLACSWLASDDESGIQYYSYAVGTQPGYSDIVGWTDTGATTSVSLDDLALTAEKSYYVSVTATNWASLTSSVGVSNPFSFISTEADDSIGSAKKLADESPVQLQGKVVTAVFDSCVYIEEINRSSAIRCIVSSSVKAGAIVNVTGAMATRYGERVINSAVLTDTGLTAEIKPFYMPCNFSKRPGIDPAGLLVRIFGRVTKSGESYYVISDGTDITSPRGAAGIEVRSDTTTGKPLGTYVTVTGIACRELANSTATAVVRLLEDSAPVSAIAPASEE